MKNKEYIISPRVVERTTALLSKILHLRWVTANYHEPCPLSSILANAQPLLVERFTDIFFGKVFDKISTYPPNQVAFFRQIASLPREYTFVQYLTGRILSLSESRYVTSEPVKSYAEYDVHSSHPPAFWVQCPMQFDVTDDIVGKSYVQKQFMRFSNPVSNSGREAGNPRTVGCFGDRFDETLLNILFQHARFFQHFDRDFLGIAAPAYDAVMKLALYVQEYEKPPEIPNDPDYSFFIRSILPYTYRHPASAMATKFARMLPSLMYEKNASSGSHFIVELQTLLGDVDDIRNIPWRNEHTDLMAAGEYARKNNYIGQTLSFRGSEPSLVTNSYKGETYASSTRKKLSGPAAFVYDCVDIAIFYSHVSDDQCNDAMALLDDAEKVYVDFMKYTIAFCRAFPVELLISSA